MRQENLSSSVSGSGGWEAPVAASAALLELTGSEHPELLEFQSHVLANSTMSFALEKLAAELDVAPQQVGETMWRACRDLDRLETRRASWRDPTKVLESPNLAALFHAGTARLKRLSDPARRRRLEIVLRRVEQAYRQARSRAWIEDFIGRPQKPRPEQDAGPSRLP